MIFGTKESILRKGYNNKEGIIVVEQKRHDGSIFNTAYIACGPIIRGKGKSFEQLCKEYNVEEIKERQEAK